MREKQRQEASDSFNDMTIHVEEDRKTLCQEVEAHIMALKTLDGEVIGLKVTLNDSLQRTMQAMFGVHGQAVEQEKRLCTISLILVEDSNPFQDAPKGVQDGGRAISVQDVSD